MGILPDVRVLARMNEIPIALLAAVKFPRITYQIKFKNKTVL